MPTCRWGWAGLAADCAVLLAPWCRAKSSPATVVPGPPQTSCLRCSAAAQVLWSVQEEMVSFARAFLEGEAVGALKNSTCADVVLECCKLLLGPDHSKLTVRAGAGRWGSSPALDACLVGIVAVSVPPPCTLYGTP